jgi:HNH endonuclease
MKRSAITIKIRHTVAKRAEFRCEYCRVHEDDRLYRFQIEHIVAIKHGGGSEIDNLAYACPHCNQYKGTDLVTFLLDYDDLVPIYNPRKMLWIEHFKVDNGSIIAKTRTGEATIKLLNLNIPDAVILRQLLMDIERYP